MRSTKQTINNSFTQRVTFCSVILINDRILFEERKKKPNQSEKKLTIFRRCSQALLFSFNLDVRCARYTTRDGYFVFILIIYFNYSDIERNEMEWNATESERKESFVKNGSETLQHILGRFTNSTSDQLKN